MIGKDPKLYNKALLLSHFTVLYNLLEGIVSFFVGLLAGSIALVRFGLDSFVESLSGGVMIWRLTKHGKTSEEEEKTDAKATRLISYTFFLFLELIFYMKQ